MVLQTLLQTPIAIEDVDNILGSPSGILFCLGSEVSWKNVPDSATSAMGTPCSRAMKPSTEKMAKPAMKLVALFRKQSMMQSLQRGRSERNQCFRLQNVSTCDHVCTQFPQSDSMDQGTATLLLNFLRSKKLGREPKISLPTLYPTVQEL